MKKLANLVPSIMIILFLLFAAGCGGGGSESDPVNAKSETSNDYGVAIPATSYANASTITLLRDNGEGYVAIENGEVFEPGESVRLAVRVEGGAYSVERLLIRDNTGQAEVKYDNNLKLYTIEYVADDKNSIIPILIQAVHPNGKASKAKYVFTTKEGAKSNALVRNGLGVLVGKDVLASAAGMELSGLPVKNLVPSGGSSVMKLSTELLGLPITLPFTLVDGLKGNETDDAIAPTLKLAPFTDKLAIIDLGINSMKLDSMLGGMADLDGNGEPNEIAGLKLDKKPLYLDINGVPKMTTANAAALSIGLFMAEGEAGVFPEGITLHPGSGDISHTELSGINNDASAIIVSLSDVNMTQFLSSMLNGYVVIPALDIPLAVPNYKGVKPAVDQKLKISFNKSGVAMDFSGDDAIMTVKDLRIEYIENGINKWMMSLDLGFKLNAGSHQEDVVENSKKDKESFLDVYLTFIPELASCIVLKDDMGIPFDNSGFASMLVEGLKDMMPISENDLFYDKNELQLKLSITTGATLKGDVVEGEGFGLMLLEDATTASIKDGKCFLNMATEKTDLSKAGLCFVNTAK